MGEEKPENIETNTDKLWLFIEHATNIKAIFVVFFLALTLTLLNPSNFNIKPGDYADIIGTIAGIFSLVLVLQVIIWIVTRPYMVISNYLKNSTEKNDSNNVSKYYWNGIIDGENQEGGILAQSKEDASKQLRDKKVIITQLKLADDQRQDNTKPEKQKNTETNKIRLFIKRARSGKVAFWIFTFTLIYAEYSSPYTSALTFTIPFVLAINYLMVIWFITQPYMVLSDNKKSTFEKFLFMFAWLFIPIFFAWVFIPMYQGFNPPHSHKYTASLANFNNASSFISAELTKCGISDVMILKQAASTGATSYSPCQNSASDLTTKLVAHFKWDAWKNPYTNEDLVITGSPAKGDIQMVVDGDETIKITAKVEDPKKKEAGEVTPDLVQSFSLEW